MTPEVRVCTFLRYIQTFACSQELHEAEQAFKDVCDQISKAERFFPVPGAPGMGSGNAPTRGAQALPAQLTGQAPCLTDRQLL